ncbi:hypothetical protein CPB84DRAFT_1756267 [Gymnopilus junonius]|uniref:Uncharacterized protein n=1 Tax=Gymnopilus junonius TaxID=109634 RepID=A0A9P5TEE9_GYMJU|nr:hypothetical protein CPB84DRAFT_1756267 [Gymnopilus junonius]
MAVLPSAVHLHHSCWPLMHRPGYGSCTQQLHVFVELKATAEGQGGWHRSSNKDSTSDLHSQADRGGVAGAASASSSTHGQATSGSLLNAREMGMAVVREVGGSFSSSLLQRGRPSSSRVPPCIIWSPIFRKRPTSSCEGGAVQQEMSGDLAFNTMVIEGMRINVTLCGFVLMGGGFMLITGGTRDEGGPTDIYSVSIGRLLPPSPCKSKPEADILPFLINSPTPTSLAQKSKLEVGQCHLMFGQPLQGIWISQGSLKGGVACKYPSKAVPEMTGDGNPHP